MENLMKKFIIISTVLLTLLLPNFCLAQAPHELAGFVLGGKMADYKNMLNLETILPIRYFETLKEAETKKIEGYKSGLITFGTCIDPWRIGRIKFKYADTSKKFYNQLLKRFKTRFGEPDEWRGDPFHIVIAWKWSFTDKDNNQISLILQHNTRDAEEKKGNSVKMTMWNLIEEENQCFEKKQAESLGQSESQNGSSSRKKINWDLFIPR
jgi:hypothetical protein